MVRLLLALLLLTTPASAGMVIGSGAAVCTVWEQNETIDTTNAIGQSNTLEYAGTIITNSTIRTICQIDLYSGGETGVIDSYNYYCRIFSLTGTDLNASLGISNAVPGTTMDDAGWKTFTFATNPVTPAADFAVVFFVDTDVPADVTDADFDASNYGKFSFNNEGDAWVASLGKMYWKNSDKTRTSVDAEDDLGLRIWTQ